MSFFRCDFCYSSGDCGQPYSNKDSLFLLELINQLFFTYSRYTREAYIDLVEHVQRTLPGVSLSSDFIAGFCGETEAEHEDTLSLLRLIKYNYAFLFAYSMRQVSYVKTFSPIFFCFCLFICVFIFCFKICSWMPALVIQTLKLGNIICCKIAMSFLICLFVCLFFVM